MAKKRVKHKEAEEKEKPAKSSKENERQLKWIIIVMIVVIVIAAGIYFIAPELRKFKYGGLKFEKIMYGKIPVYHAKIPMTDADGKLVANYNLYLRNDPRELKNISLDGKIILMKDMYVSLDPDVEYGCDDSGIAGANFFSFLKVAGVNAKLAYTNRTYAQEKNASFSTCEVNKGPNYGFIVIKRGDSNEIIQKTENCYEIHFKECDIISVTERFIVSAIAHAKGVEV